MKKNQCKEALEIYKTFLNRMTKLSEFLKVAEVTSVCPAAPPQRGREYPSGANLGGRLLLINIISTFFLLSF